MKKIILTILAVLTFIGISSSLNVKANTTPLNNGDTVVITDLTSRYNLPKTFVKGQELPTYEYEGDIIPDFRRYFEVSVNRETVLNVHGQNPVDKGGYDWNFAGFDINRLGPSAVILTYGSSFLRITFTIVETDDIPPFIYDPDRPTEGTLPQRFVIEAGRNIASQFVKFRVRDNIDDDRMLVSLNSDNTYSFRDEFFTGHELLENIQLNTEYILEVRIEDSAGNVFEQTIEIILVDTTPPTIYNIPNIETNKGNPVNYKANLRVEDNHTVGLENFITIFDIINEDNEVIGQEEDIEDLFNQLGEHRIRLRVTDQSGNTSSRVIRLVVKNPITIAEVVLYINLVGLSIVVLGVGIHFVRKRRMENDE